MIDENMSNSSLNIFPISGRNVCDFLGRVLCNDDSCVIRYFEALGRNEMLGDLWRRVCSSKNEVIKKEDLLVILVHADQIVTLDMYVKGDPRRILYIEDGALFEDTMSTDPAPRTSTAEK